MLLKLISKGMRMVAPPHESKKNEGIVVSDHEIEKQESSTFSFYERLPIIVPGELQERMKKYIS